MLLSYHRYSVLSIVFLCFIKKTFKTRVIYQYHKMSTTKNKRKCIRKALQITALKQISSTATTIRFRVIITVLILILMFLSIFVYRCFSLSPQKLIRWKQRKIIFLQHKYFIILKNISRIHFSKPKFGAVLFRKWSKVWSSNFYHHDTIWSRHSTCLGRRGSDDHLGRHSLPLSSNRATFYSNAKK